ncbi:hypothetical protein PFISCL1PPCAC_3445, partial [Pristionchus fissidentatus]
GTRQKLAGIAKEMDDPSNRRCLICTVPVTVPYYGIDACRACALFFKRTKSSGKKFVCRQGGRQCVLVKGTKPICRSCRFDRCITSGMKYDKKAKVENAFYELPKSSLPDLDTRDPKDSKADIKGIDQAQSLLIEHSRSRELQQLQQ